jgi:uncharacterized protein YgiM (DUF1202 family)
MKKLLPLISAITLMLLSCGMSASPAISAAPMREAKVAPVIILATPTKEKPQFMCATDKLIYVRAKAGTNYKVIALLDFYTLTGHESHTRDNGIWYQVRTHKGIVGWVNARLIREYCGIRY